MSEYKEMRFRLYFNMAKEEQKKVYEILSGCHTASERNNILMQMLISYFSSGNTEQKKAVGNEVSGDVKQTIDALYNHIRVINERLSILEYGKASEQTEVLPINTTSPAAQPEQKLHAPAAPEPEVIPVKEVEVSDIDNSASNSSDTSFDIDIPDDLLDYVNSLK